MKKKMRGLLIGTFVGLSSVPLIISVGLIHQRDWRLNQKLTANAQIQKTDLTDQSRSLLPSHDRNQSQNLDAISRRDLVVESDGTLTGLTQNGNQQANIVIPTSVRRISSKAFNDFSARLRRVIFEKRDGSELKFDPRSIQKLVPRVHFYVHESEQSSHLMEDLAAAVPLAQILFYTYDDSHHFYIADSPLMSETPGLIGLTPKGQTYGGEVLVLPNTVRRIYENAFSNLPGTVREIDWPIHKEIKLVGTKYFDGLSGVKKIRVREAHQAVEFILKGLNLENTKVLIDGAGGEVDVKVVGVCIVGFSDDNHVNLIGLMRDVYGHRHLTIPDPINVIDASVLKRVIDLERVEFLHEGHLIIDGQLPKIQYTTGSPVAARDLINAGIERVDYEGGDEKFTLYVDQDFILKDRDNGDIELYGLSPVGKTKTSLIVPRKVRVIGQYAQEDINVNRIEFEGDKEVKIEGKLPSDWNCAVGSIKTAFNLLSSGVKSVIFDQKNERSTLMSEDGLVYQISSAPGSKWVGVLEAERGREKLVISSETNVVGKNAFDDIEPSHVKFEYTGEIRFEGSVPNIEYEVKNAKTAATLRDLGITKPITLSPNNKNFVEKVESGCAIRHDGSKSILIGLTKDGKRQNMIEVPQEVSVVSNNAFDGSDPKKIKLLQSGVVRFEGSVPNVEYEVHQLATARNLINAGVTERIWVDDKQKGLFLVQAKGSCILKTNESGIGLLELTSRGKREKIIRVPHDVNYISENAFANSLVSKIILESISMTEFKGSVPDVKYEVNNQITAQNLYDFKLTKPIVVNVDGKTYRDYLEGYCWLRDENDMTKLVGLTKQGKSQKTLTIPAKVNLVDKDVWKKVSAEKIIFESNQPVDIEGRVLDVDYEVNNTQTAFNLFNYGANRPISVSENGEKFVLENEDETIVKTDGSEEVTLVGLTEAGKKFEELVISKRVNTIGKNALDESEAIKVGFNHGGPIRIVGLLPNKRYHVHNSEETIENIINAEVDTPIVLHKNGEFFVERNQNGLLVRESSYNLMLRKIIKDARNKTELVVPSQISVIGSDAFGQANATKITIKGERVEIRGPVRNTNYEVKNFDIAQQLVDHGVTETIAVRSENDDFEIYVKDGCVIKSEKGVHTLIDLKKWRIEDPSELVIPSEVSVIAEDALVHISAPKVRFLHEGFVKVEKELTDTEYFVNDLQTAVDIAKMGITKNISVNNPDGVISRVWLEDLFIFEQKNDLVCLASLTDDARKLSRIIVPAKVGNVHDNAFDGASASEVIFEKNGSIIVNQKLPDLSYEVKNGESAVNLIRAKVKRAVKVNGSDGKFLLQAEGDFILRSDPDQKFKSLFSLLDPSHKSLPLLKIPKDVGIFDYSVLSEANPKRVQFLSDDEVTIIGPVGDIEYEVNNINTAINLINAGTTKAITVNEDDETFTVYADNDTIIKHTEDGKRSLIGITITGKNRSSLDIPKNVSVVDYGALNQTARVKNVSFLSDNEVRFNGEVPGVISYKVGNVQTGTNLFRAGVKNKVSLVEGENTFDLNLIGDTISKSDKSGKTTLLNLTWAGEFVEELSIPAKINVINADVFTDISAQKISFETEDELEIIGNLPQKSYFVKNENNVEKIIKAGVETPVTSLNDGRIFVEKLRDGLFVRLINDQNVLRKLDDSAKQAEVLVIPSDISVIDSGALDGATAYQISIESDKIKLVGSVPDVRYKVKNFEIADQLVNAGVNNTIVITDGKNYSELKVRDGFVIKNENEVNTLLRLKNDLNDSPEQMTIPFEVNVIGSGALTNAKANTIHIQNRGETKIHDRVPNRDYFVHNFKTGINLVQLGVDKNVNVSLIDYTSNILVKDGCILNEDENKTTLLGFLKKSDQPSTLIIPPSVNVIDKDAFEGIVPAQISLMSEEVVELSGAVPNVEYEVRNIDNAVNLIRKGVQKKIKVHTNDKIFTLQAQGNFIVQADAYHEVVSLFGLVDPLKTEFSVLEIPENINTFNQKALDGKFVQRIKFLHNGVVTIIGSVANIEYEVNHVDSAVNLANANVTEKISVVEKNEIYTVQSDGRIIVKINQADEKILIGLTNSAKDESLIIIPDGILRVKRGALENTRATKIFFEADHEVDFEGEFPNAEYHVHQIKNAFNLIKRNPTLKVSLTEKGQIFKIWTDNGYTFKTDPNSISELLQISDELLGKEELEIPDHVGIISENLLLKSKANRIQFHYVGSMKFIGDVPNIDYEVNNTKTANVLLLEKGVKIPVIVNESGRTVTQKVMDNFVIQVDGKLVTLVGIEPQLLGDKKLDVISEVNIVGDDALSGSAAKQIDFLHDGEVRINGVVPDINYGVKRMKTALNLIHAGAKTGNVFVHENGKITIVKVEEGCIITISENGERTLIGVERDYPFDKIIVPSGINVIDLNELRKTKFRSFRINKKGGISVRGNVPGISFEVPNTEIAGELFKRGVTTDISVNNEMLLRKICHCTLEIRGDKVSLDSIDSGDAPEIVIPAIVTHIEDKGVYWLGDGAKRVIFQKNSKLKTITENAIKAMRNVIILVYDEEVIDQLRLLRDFRSLNIGIARGDFFVSHSNPSKIFGLTETGREKKDLVQVPKDVLYFWDDAFYGFKAKKLDFTKILDSSKVEFRGQMFEKIKTRFLVKDTTMAKKLQFAGGDRGQIQMLSLKSNKLPESNRYIGIIIVSIFVGILTVGLGLGICKKNKRNN